MTKEHTMQFAEWMDINCIRAGEHEWTYKAENWESKRTTAEMLDIFIDIVNTLSKALPMPVYCTITKEQYMQMRELRTNDEEARKYNIPFSTVRAGEENGLQTKLYGLLNQPASEYIVSKLPWLANVEIVTEQAALNISK